MNWKVIYQSFTTVQAAFALYLISLILYFFSLAMVIPFIMLLLTGIYFWYSYELNQVLTQKKEVSKKLRNLEYTCYVITLLFTARFVLAVIHYVFNEDAYEYYDFTLLEELLLSSLLNSIILLFLIILSIFTFIKRKKELGNYDFSEKLREKYEIDKFKNKRFENNEERIQLCLSCVHRKPNTSVGLTCGLTNEKPAFETFCSHYLEDEKETERIQELYPEETPQGFWASWKGSVILAILGFIRAGFKGLDDPLGILFLVLGFIWLFAALFFSKKRN